MISLKRCQFHSPKLLIDLLSIFTVFCFYFNLFILHPPLHLIKYKNIWGKKSPPSLFCNVCQSIIFVWGVFSFFTSSPYICNYFPWSPNISTESRNCLGCAGISRRFLSVWWFMRDIRYCVFPGSWYRLSGLNGLLLCFKEIGKCVGCAWYSGGHHF